MKTYTYTASYFHGVRIEIIADNSTEAAFKLAKLCPNDFDEFELVNVK